MATHTNKNLQFKLEEEIEVRSFIVGFRGAWFRCKIHDIKVRRGGHVEYSVEYYDFPEEKLTWTRAYEKPNKLGSKSELMIRPKFPFFYKENEKPNQDPSNDIKAIVHKWRIGDSVDLWYEDCFWSGKINRFIDDGTKVEVELPDHPIGEGGLYIGSIKDLRPTLNWSLENGWTVPISTANGESWYAARIVNTRNSGSEQVRNSNDLKTNRAKKETPSCSNAPLKQINSPLVKTTCQGIEQQFSKREDLETDNNSIVRRSKYVMKQRDPIDSLIMELEELANKLRWMEEFMENGGRCSNDVKPSWKFLAKKL